MKRKFLVSDETMLSKHYIECEISNIEALKSHTYGMAKVDLYFHYVGQGIEPNEALRRTDKELKKSGILNLCKPSKPKALTDREIRYRANLDRAIEDMEALRSKLAIPLGKQLSLNL